MGTQFPLSCVIEPMALAPIHDFTFVVGGEQYPINKYAGCVLSPTSIENIEMNQQITEQGKLKGNPKEKHNTILSIWNSRSTGVP
jgi:hypothetical protein